MRRGLYITNLYQLHLFIFFTWKNCNFCIEDVENFGLFETYINLLLKQDNINSLDIIIVYGTPCNVYRNTFQQRTNINKQKLPILEMMWK